jgi:4-hydroxyphenylpyruvate dioxygenase-like putative hemolysin
LKISEVKSQALDTIGHLSKAVGKERFSPYLEFYTKEALAIISQEKDDFSMREAAFGYL